MNEQRLRNLLRDSQELRVVLGERVGGSGQHTGDEPNKFYLPLWGPTCQVVLTYDSARIVAVDRGPALSAEEWERLTTEIENSVTAGLGTVGRDFSFNTFRVLGSWRGPRSRVQILPPPDGVPSAPMAMADHPFILEFPIQKSDIPSLTNHRRMRDHRRLTLLLNVLLRGGTTVQPRRPDHFWAAVPRDDAHLEKGVDIKWVQEFFFSEHLGRILIDDLSPPSGPPLEEVSPKEYYNMLGHDGQPMRFVPADLDQWIYLYWQLSPPNREKFDRAAFWLDAVSRQWTFSISSSFASLVIALESLTGQGTSHQTKCNECDWTGTHDVPGATARLRMFFADYAPGISPETLAKIPRFRGAIVHGGTLMQLDQDRAFGWDPPELEETELIRELGGLTKVALRNWLKNPPA
jgi:hypothetical protein